ncbi:MAG: DUF5329 family protein, partial [Deltaproteobacteria bacterium]|nr:DUF5329 family protein [Deltaproteobacteria bacterium]
MTIRALPSLLIILLASVSICLQSATASEDLDSTINYLLEYVTNSDVVFIRNNQDHTGEEASIHMRKKYEHFKEQVKTPEDFIRLAGTKSFLSGTPYQVRMKDGTTLLTHKWL